MGIASNEGDDSHGVCQRELAEFVPKVISRVEVAEFSLVWLGEKWGVKDPQILRSCEDNWAELTTCYKYPEEIRRLIYTANAAEGFYSMLRRFTKAKTIYPSDNSLIVYLSINEITKKWSMSVNNWGIVIG